MYSQSAIIGVSFLFLLASCQSEPNQTSPEAELSAPAAGPGQSAVVDDVSQPNIVQVASGSADHSTLVAAVKAAGLVDALSNVGPFTVFAPTNAAFDKLPEGTVENLLKEENLADLKSILEYHTYVGSLRTTYFQSGQQYEQVNGGKIKIDVDDKGVLINGKARIIASISAANGMIHVIDEVLLP